MTLTLTVAVDCSLLTWLPFDEPSDSFVSGATALYSPNREVSLAPDGVSWSSHCGNANIVYTGVVDAWMTVDSDFIITVFPNDIEVQGTYQITATKQDPNNLVPDLIA
jgi:hypothetical protein